MTDLTDFLEARIAEDEAAAERGRRHNDSGTYANDNYGCLLVDPARVLAQCAAHRAIVEEHKMMEPRFNIVWRDGCCETCTAYGEYGGPNKDGSPNPCPTLRTLAGIYADHEGFDPEWGLS